MRLAVKNLIRTSIVCGMVMAMNSFASMAAIGPGFTAGTYVATITADSVNINKSSGGDEVLLTASSGSQYEVLEDLGDGWMKIRVNDSEGYLPASGNATVAQVGKEEMSEVQQDAIESSNSYKRQQVVNYGLQLVGGRYRYGGSDPRTGVDCSGFTKYVLQNGGGVTMSRSSTSQSRQGVQVSPDQMQPGDLIFYGGSSNSINHVAMYIGNGQVVHASTEETGIIVSEWNYRKHVRIMNVLG